MTNKKDFAILEKIEFLKQLKDKDKESLLDLINDKDTKILTEQYTPALTIANKKHQLTIHYTSQIWKWARFKTKEGASNDYHYEALKSKQEQHEDTRYDKSFNLVINQIGDFEKIPDDYYEYFRCISNVILTLSYEFYLDDELIIIRNYNADLNYFLKNSSKYAPIDVYNFFNEEVTSFNKTNYEILTLFKAEQYFDKINAFDEFDRYFNYNKYFKEQKEPKTDYCCEVFLSTVYFKEVCVPKLQSLIKHNLDILAKNGFNYELKIKQWTNQDTLLTGSLDNDPIYLNSKNFYWGIIDKKTNKNLFLGWQYFNFTFYGLLYEYWNGNDFKETMKKLDELIIEVANEINKHLQHNEIVAYHKILKMINHSANNVSFNELVNNITKNDTNINLDDISSRISFLQFDYGHLKIEKDDDCYLDTYVLVWKYVNNVLYFQRFNVSNLCILLIKHKELDKIPLKHHITNPQSFKKIVYRINGYGIEFSLKINGPKDDKKPYENKALRELPKAQQYTKYINYCKLSANPYTKILTFDFLIKLESNDNIDELIHNIYNEFEDKIILKENVQKKMKK